MKHIGPEKDNPLEMQIFIARIERSRDRVTEMTPFKILITHN